MTNGTHRAPADIAQEHRYDSGVSRDYSLESELRDFAGDEAAEAEQEARWEREGRAEMLDTLFGDWQGF